MAATPSARPTHLEVARSRYASPFVEATRPCCLRRRRCTVADAAFARICGVPDSHWLGASEGVLGPAIEKMAGVQRCSNKNSSPRQSLGALKTPWIGGIFLGPQD